MKHLLIVSDAWEPQVNGVVTTLKAMVEHASEHNWKVTVIHPGLFETCQMPGYPQIRVVTNPWKLKSMIPSDINAIHIATEGPLGIAARLLFSFKKWQFTTGYHTNFPEYIQKAYGISSKISYVYFKWFHRKSKAVFTPSFSTTAKLFDKGFKNLITWCRGYNEDTFKPERRSDKLFNPSKINLVYVGRVSREKNIEAFLELAKDPQYQLCVVGDGPAAAELARQDKAVFVGFKYGNQLAQYYASADVFVFPSKTDTLGIVSIEAMACGTPVAAYDVEGPRDVVKQGQGGYLAKEGTEVPTLEVAVQKALELRNNPSVLENARLYSWQKAAFVFYNCLVDIK